MGKADKVASEADMGAIAKINLTTMAIVSISYGVVAFLCTYVAQEPMKMFVNSLPEVITHGLEVAWWYFTSRWIWYVVTCNDENKIHTILYSLVS